MANHTEPRPHALVRPAVEQDLPKVVELFALPDEGNQKGDEASLPLASCYSEAFAAIRSDPNNYLYVVEVDGAVAGAFQLTFIRYVAFRGGRVAQIENVVVEPALRGRGLGAFMMEWAVERARAEGCFRIQLTTNVVRHRARLFYERLGFVASHHGMRRLL